MRRALTTIVACTAASLLLAPAASAIDRVDTKKLRKGVTLDGILEHQRAFQNIAIAHDDNRAATTSGYDASVEYVSNRLRAAGYRVTLDEFDFPMWRQNGPAMLSETAPTPRPFTEGTDFIVAQFSSSGNVTANVVPTTDAQFPAPGGPGTSTSGCEPGDFPAATAGNIALMQRGTCPFTQKYQMAKDAGAAAALIFNDGFPDREAPLATTAPPNVGIPAAMISSQVGRVALDRGTVGHGDAQHGRRRDHDAEHRGQRDRGQPARRPRPHDRRRRPPRQRRGGPGHQRQRLRLVGDPRDRRGGRRAAQRQAAQPAAVRVLGRRGGRPGRLYGVRGRAGAERWHRGHRGQPQLRHDRLAELRALRVRRRHVGHRAAAGRGAERLRSDRAAVPAALRSGRVSRPTRRRSTAARTMARSSRTASRPVVCSPGPSSSRRSGSSRSTAASPACRSTPTTTRMGTPSST